MKVLAVWYPIVGWLFWHLVTNRQWRRPLPDRLVIAYANWGQCDESIARSIDQGANVIIWFSANLVVKNGSTQIGGALPNMSCVASTVRRYPHITHTLSIGGFNAPLPPLTHDGIRWFRVWHAWNARIARTHQWRGFDGVDWDLEGAYSPSANVFSTRHLDIVGRFSHAAASRGYVVSMAPAQSFLDADEPRFDTLVTHAPAWAPDFHYHGRNLYAYVLARYHVDTFDWVCVQLYEGWSRANYNLAVLRRTPSAYLRGLVQRMEAGWTVRFGARLGQRRVAVPRHKLVLGLANGWARPFPPATKFLYVSPSDLRRTADCVRPLHRGFAFWTIGEEGRIVGNQTLYLAREISQILTRVNESERSECL